MSLRSARAILAALLFLACACSDSGKPEPPVALPLSEADVARLARANQAMLAGLPERVHGVLGDLLTLDPTPPGVQFVAGSAAYELHQYGEAITRISDAVRVNAAYLPNSSALGFAYLKLGDFDAARAAFENIVEVAPHKHKAHYGLGLAALSVDDLEDARPSLIEALRLAPDYLKARFALARLLSAEGQHGEALNEVTVVVDRWPSHDEALYLRGRLLTALGRGQEAEKAFARHKFVYATKESLGGLAGRLGTSQDSPALRLQMVELHLGLGDVREARRALSAARSLYPGHPLLEQARSRLP
jgi:tetratricopeptide (TPR) repeat protein